MRRFSQCTETCTTDCGHCKGRPVEALRADNEHLREEITALRSDRQFELNRANEAARLSAAARDDADHLRRELAHLQDHVADVERDRLDTDAWAVNLVAELGLPHDGEPFEMIARHVRHLTRQATA